MGHPENRTSLTPSTRWLHSTRRRQSNRSDGGVVDMSCDGIKHLLMRHVFPTLRSPTTTTLDILCRSHLQRRQQVCSTSEMEVVFVRFSEGDSRLMPRGAIFTGRLSLQAPVCSAAARPEGCSTGRTRDGRSEYV